MKQPKEIFVDTNGYDPLDKHTKNAVISYLESFPPAFRAGTPLIDIRTGAIIDSLHGISAYTDNVWCWDTTDIYLLKRYDIPVNKTFLDSKAFLEKGHVSR